MAAALASAVLAAIEARIVAAPSLGVRIADHLRGVTTQQRTHKGVAVWRDRTSNRRAEARQQDHTQVDDSIVVQLSYRVAPKAQRTSARAAMDIADSLIQRVADCDDSTLAPHHPVFVDELETHQGEWVVITQRYSFRRQQALGGA